MSETSNLTVSRLVALIQEVVETNFVSVTVQGELSNFARPASGHWYFTLKDAGAQLRAVMFRGRNRLLDTPPENGMQVVCSGVVTIYAARGEMQLVVNDLVPAGVGDLQTAFEALKQRLRDEGLFDEARKQPLPGFPRCVGVVTSATGAAIHDILNVLRRRAPGLQVMLCPVKVQGEGAAEEIAKAIAMLNEHGGPDVLIVGRGGGSLEDLWAFNEEGVALAIAASTIPVISAVGHEVDFTIADFVADLRAPTPSAAAELVAKSRLELDAHLDHLTLRLRACLQQSVSLTRERLDRFEDRLRSAGEEFASLQLSADHLSRRLVLAMQGQMRTCRDRLALGAGRLDALSPLSQLARGYAIASLEKDGAGLTDVSQLSTGDRFWLRLAKGRLRGRVEEIDE